MLELSLTVYGRLLSIAAAALPGAGYREAVEEARRINADDHWVTVTGSSAAVSNPRHLVTAALYAATGTLRGATISSYPEIELLLYLLGTRNIGEALREAERGHPPIGAAAVSIGGHAAPLLESLAERLGASLDDPRRGEWAGWYAGYLARQGGRAPRDEEATLALLRARAALVRLSV